MEQLKPCPFCGKEPSFEVSGYMEDGKEIKYYTIACYECEGTSCTTSPFYSAGEAIKAWNRRAKDE